MKFHSSQGSKTFTDGHTVKYKELEIRPAHGAAFVTIRIYPSNTFVTYHNSYKNYSKVIHKAPHVTAQQNMNKWLKDLFENMRIRLKDSELDTIMSRYWDLV